MSTESMVTQAKKRFHVEGQTSTLGERWQIWDGEAHFARFKNIADEFDAHEICAALNEGHRHQSQQREAVLEAAARVAESYDLGGLLGDDLPKGWRGCRRQIAAAIRALKTAPASTVPLDEYEAAGELACLRQELARAAYNLETGARLYQCPGLDKAAQLARQALGGDKRWEETMTDRERLGEAMARGIACEVMAEMLGVDDIHPESRGAQLIVEGIKRYADAVRSGDGG